MVWVFDDIGCFLEAVTPMDLFNGVGGGGSVLVMDWKSLEL